MSIRSSRSVFTDNCQTITFFESLYLPMNVSIMVIEVQWFCSLLIQVLGLDNDKHVVEVILSFLLTFFKSESSLSVHISFDQFLAHNIHKQLVNFLSLRHLRYYTNLLNIFLETNKREFLEATFISNECRRITLLIFINNVMSIIYNLIFNMLAANPIFFRLLSKAAYTPCGIMTNHCRIVLMDMCLIFSTITIQFRLSFHNCKCENTCLVDYTVVVFLICWLILDLWFIV
jgi:hypothetical protein